MMNLAISGILVIAAVIGFAYLTNRGVNIILIAVLVGGVVSFGSSEGFAAAFFGTFPAGMASFLEKMSLSVFLGMAFGFIMTASGANESIALFFCEKIGSRYAPYIVLVITVIFAASGTSGSVFIVAPISYSLMKAANLPNYIGLFSFCCGLHLTLYGAAGIPGTVNIMPTTYLGTDLYAGGLISYLAIGVGFLVSVLAIRRYTRSARRRGVGFDVNGLYGVKETSGKRPHVLIAAIPVALVLGGCFALVKYGGLSSVAAACASQTVAILFVILACRNCFSHGYKTVLETIKGAFSKAAVFLITCACLSGFAEVVATTPFYSNLLGALTQMKIGVYATVLICTAVISAITADAPSGVIMTLNTLAPGIVAAGTANLGAVHRITVMASTTLSSLPHCGAVLQFLECFGYTHKTGYRYVFISTVCITSLVAVIATILAEILY